MAKKFKSKRIKHRIKIIFYISVFTVSFTTSLSFFSHFFQKEEVLNFLLKTTILTQKKNYKTSSNILDFLLEYTIGEQDIEDIYDGSLSMQEYISDPAPEENKHNPIIYLYNTHQGEEYTKEKLAEYNVIPTVMLASYRLREKLNQLGLNTIVETNQMSDILRINGWNYSASYKASRILLENAQEQFPTLKYYFDVHRDAISYEASKVTYQNKDYARVLFVIGIEHDTWQENYQLAEKICNKLDSKIPGITRGITKKGGKGVNGIYNQDFSSKTLLFEIGGQYNKIEEVNNTIIVLAQVLKEIIG